MVIEAQEIHQGFIDAALDYMPKYKCLQINQDNRDRLNKLNSIGLTNSKTTRGAKVIEKESKQAEFFNFFSTHFPWVIILEEDTFISLLEKYNLACGTLDNYIGEIPDENINEILDSINILKKVQEDNIWSNVGQYIYKELELKGQSRLIDPIMTSLSHQALFSREERLQMQTKYNETKSTEDNCFKVEFDIAAKLIGRFPFTSVIQKVKSNLEYLKLHIPQEQTIKATSLDLFVAAPEADILKRVKVEFLEEIEAKDPFVFQITPYGVVIFSKWGEEANDSIFK